MLYQLSKEYNIINDYSKADILIVNTCAFIFDAKEESINTIFELAKYKKNNCKLLVATGCLSQRYAKELLDEIPEIDLLIGVEQYLNTLQHIKKALAGERFAACERVAFALQGKRILTTPKHTAYVKIAEGCNNSCTFCAIPLIRGRYRSVPMEDVLAEMQSLADKGVKELILIAEDTTRYGIDLYKKPCLPELLDKAAQIKGLKWIRLLYCYPDTMSMELLDVMSKHDNICKYIDIPLQHYDEQVLKAMNRRGTPKDFKHLLTVAKDRGFAIRTTIIVGFPGETEQQFNALYNFVNEFKFDRLGAFTYSMEEGTVAAKMPMQIDENIKQNRLDRLMELQAEISMENNQKHVGTEREVLVEKIGRDGFIHCRSQYEAPDVDGEILLPINKNVKVGQFYNIKIVRADTYDLYGEWMEV